MEKNVLMNTLICYIQDSFETPDEMKFPLTKKILKGWKKIYPENVYNEMIKLENSWCDSNKNIHHSPYFIGENWETETTFYLHIGNVNFQDMCEVGIFPKGKFQDYLRKSFAKREKDLLKNNFYPKKIYNIQEGRI